MLLYSYAGIIGRFSRFKSRRGKQAEAENNVENDDGGGRSNSGVGGDGSPSEYLNLNQNDEVIQCRMYVF